MIGRWATLGGFATLFGGLLYSCTSLPARMSGQEVVQTDLSLWVPWFGLVAGYALITFGKEPWLRFAIRPRPDEALALNLKTLDNKSLLFNYVSAFPVDHLLVSPGGLVVIVTKPVLGDIVVTGERYRRQRGMFGWLQFVSEGALGNPGREALNGVEEIRAYLAQLLGAEIAEKVPIHAMVVFTHPRATVTLDGPTVPTSHVREVRNELRRVTGQAKVPGDVARRLEYELIQAASGDGEPINAGEAVDRKPRRRVSRPTRAR